LPVSTGIPDHPTHTGSFEIGRRDENHVSSLYGHCVGPQGRRRVERGAADCRRGERYVGAPMPYFQSFNGAEGFHVGTLPGHPDSHGCVHLSRRDAAWLWNWAARGTLVDVVRSIPRRLGQPSRQPRAPRGGP
jgi:lipoprotein-anchoring transpeptidase ErfK/SrfK